MKNHKISSNSHWMQYQTKKVKRILIEDLGIFLRRISSSFFEIIWKKKDYPPLILKYIWNSYRLLIPSFNDIKYTRNCSVRTGNLTPALYVRRTQVSYQNASGPWFIFKFKLLVIVLRINRLEGETRYWNSIRTVMIIHYNLAHC